MLRQPRKAIQTVARKRRPKGQCQSVTPLIQNGQCEENSVAGTNAPPLRKLQRVQTPRPPEQTTAPSFPVMRQPEWAENGGSRPLSQAPQSPPRNQSRRLADWSIAVALRHD